MELNYFALGLSIKTASEQKKLTQAKLAEQVERSTAYIGLIEVAKRHLSLVSLIRITVALELSVDKLLNECIMDEGLNEFANYNLSTKESKEIINCEKRILLELAKITAKGQITLPVNIRKKLGVIEGDKVLFIEEVGNIYITNPSMIIKANQYHYRQSQKVF